MVFFGTDFWPQFWAIIGGGAALTAMLTLLIATVPFPRRNRPQRLAPIAALSPAAPPRRNRENGPSTRF